MDNIIIQILEDFQTNNNLFELNEVFKSLIKELQYYLNLEVLDPPLNVLLKTSDLELEIDDSKIFDIGVNRKYENKGFVIEFLESFEPFLPILLLREAYYCFIPKDLNDNIMIKTIINIIIEKDLQKFKIIEKWKDIVYRNIINYDFLNDGFHRLDKLIKKQKPDAIESPTHYFFNYIRKNVSVIGEDRDTFHDALFKETVLDLSKSMYNSEIIDTIWALANIFYNVKSYRALLEYQKYFQEFKEKGTLKTELSLRKFISSIRWINKYTYIAPSYKVNWNAINIAAIMCTLRFNPLMDKANINKIIKDLPFFIQSKSSEINFAVEVSGWVMIPSVYLNDFQRFIEKLKDFGYIINYNGILIHGIKNHLNLNYFRDFYKKGRILNPNHRDFSEKYQIVSDIDYGRDFYNPELSILDFLILERVRYWSYKGFGFERRTETVKSLKSDLINEILSQRALINNLRANLKKLHDNEELNRNFINFIDKNEQFGFFYIKIMLEDILYSVNLINNFISENPNITDIYRFQEYLKKNQISKNIEDNISLKEEFARKTLIKDLIPLFFKNRSKFESEIKKYNIFYEFFKNCQNLRIFDLTAMKKIIQDQELINKIFSSKENKLKKTYEDKKYKKITSNDIDDILDKYIQSKPPIIKPCLITTINTTNFAKYYIILLLKDSSETRKLLKDIAEFFPRVVWMPGEDIFSSEKLIQAEIYLPNINGVEKKFLISCLFNLFDDKIQSFKRYFYDGFLLAYSRKDYYDFDNHQYFYTKDLFDQFFKYINKIIGMNLETFSEISKGSNFLRNFWIEGADMNLLVDKVQDRVAREQVNYNSTEIQKLLNFYLNLKETIINVNKFNEIKKEGFFKTKIESIKFKISMQTIGLSSYYLYIRPIDIDKIDFKLLLTNTFKKIMFPVNYDLSNCLMIKYFFPYRNPNKAYINWLMKSKKNISEFLLFFVKKIHFLFHFEYSLSLKGWDLDPNRFKNYLQQILFEKNFKEKVPTLRQVNIGDQKITSYLSSNVPIFKDLLTIYGWKSTDLKTFIGSRKYSIRDKILELIRKNIIFPYLKLKNLDFKEKILIILPDLSEELIELIIKIFSFFNYGAIYEIEGEFFIYGFESEKKFENGLYIKLYLPDCEFSDFQRIFNKLFQYLGIKKYIILNDMVNGESLLKSIYGDLDFLKTYNPLKNLKWSEIDQKWLNHKLFGEDFKPKYPNLTSEESESS
jgi:hypothetical protein